MPDDIDALLNVALAAAAAARPVTLGYFRSGRLGTANKSDTGFDPVTRADREAEQAIRDAIRAHRPDDAILGEEHDGQGGTTGLTWVIDPIDGTRGYLSGTPTWGTLISVARDGHPILGLIDQPYTGECFIGTPGGAELRHGGQRVPLAARNTPTLGDAILYSTFPEIGTKAEAAAFAALARQVRLTRYGMDCYAYALLAAGQIDLVVEAGLHIYDVHAPIAVIEAAGGIVTNWRGGAAADGGQVLAAGGQALHRAALEILGAAGS